MVAPHLMCSADDIAPTVLLPGDPARCDRIAAHLSNVRQVAYNREFRTCTGTYRDMPVTVTSTGIGGASTAIAAEELVQLGARTLVRVGSCGAVSRHLTVGDIVVADSAMREDGASGMYAPAGFPAAADPALVAALVDAEATVSGTVRSHDSFYTDHEAALTERADQLGILASDMETAVLFVVARLRGVRAASVLAVVVARDEETAEGIGEFAGGAEASTAGEDRAIRCALEGCLKDRHRNTPRR